MFDVSLRGKTKQTDQVLELCRLSNHIGEPAFHVALVQVTIKLHRECNCTKHNIQDVIYLFNPF